MNGVNNDSTVQMGAPINHCDFTAHILSHSNRSLPLVLFRICSGYDGLNETEGQQPFLIAKPEIESIISQGDRVAVLLRESGVFKSSGQAYSVRGVQWFTCADGKIKKIDEDRSQYWKVES
jgi:SnoaL-like domain